MSAQERLFNFIYLIRYLIFYGNGVIQTEMRVRENYLKYVIPLYHYLSHSMFQNKVVTIHWPFCSWEIILDRNVFYGRLNRLRTLQSLAATIIKPGSISIL